jgi:hypothetical protein
MELSFSYDNAIVILMSQIHLTDLLGFLSSDQPNRLNSDGAEAASQT